MIEENLVTIGQLLGTAFACGLNLYATIAVLGLSARFDLIAELPPGMRGLENGIVIGVAAGFYVVEFVIDRIPGIDHAWEAVHTLIRPAAAGLLVVLALQGAPLSLQVGAAAAAAIMALTAHGTKAGLRLITTQCWLDDAGRLRPRRRSLARTGLSLFEDAAAVGIAIAALLYPGIALGVLAGFLALLLIAGPRIWRAALLGARSVIARGRGFFGRPGWRDRSDLPRSVRATIPVEPLGSRPARGLPAAVKGLPRAGAYRHGWLVFTADGPRFVYTARFRTRAAELGHISGVVLRRGVLTDTLEVRNGSASSAVTFFLMKDGPRAELAAAELAPSEERFAAGHFAAGPFAAGPSAAARFAAGREPGGPAGDRTAR
jgi:hypothetical protein